VKDDKVGLTKDLVVAYVAYRAVSSVLELGPRGVYDATMNTVFKTLQKVPGLSGALEAEKAKTLKEIEKAVVPKDEDVRDSIPSRGLSMEAIVEKAKALRGKEDQFHKDRGMGGIYHKDGDELAKLQTTIYTLYNCSNALYPGIFSGLRKFEAEITSMIVNLLKGGSNACASLTSGGTESIILAMYVYRTYGRNVRGIKKPEVICASSAHAALDKVHLAEDVEVLHIVL
jgi:sphinganine-1-phosphate aldolase